MTTVNQRLPCSLEISIARQRPDQREVLHPDLERILSFCQKSTGFIAHKTTSLPLTSTLTQLGEQTIQSAMEGLDHQLNTLAVDYADGSDSDRKDICEELFHQLLTRTKPVRTQDELVEHVCEDVSNQSCNRIFPRQFHKHGNPNCLGRALILLAFARLAGAPVLGATPLISGSEIAIHHDARVARGILRRADRQQVRLKPELKTFLEFITARPGIDRLRPPMFHMGILMQTSAKRWTLIDPHAKVTGIYLNQRLICELNKQSLFQPEQVFDADFRVEADLKCSQQLWGLKPITDLLGELQTLSVTDQLDVGEVLVFLAESNLLEYLLSDAWNLPREEKANIAAQMRGSAAPVVDPRLLKSLSLGNCSDSLRNRTQALLSWFLLLDSGKELVGLLAFAVSEGSESLRREMLEQSTRELLEELIARLHGFQFNTASLSNERGLLHPVLELYQPEFRVGVELVSHVNAVTLRSEAIPEALSRVCPGQTIQISRATEILRNQKDCIVPSSRQAFQTLTAAEFQSERLQDILQRISQKLLLTSKNRSTHDSE
ncbi:hypothetical protein V6x_37770 [Gimesia chilikensis]|uniref:Uncharacterized protein n=1 Tax=Gimesia chilikensis TaxID=2605989 RepID=A0A517WFK6_9PLAN|nr:hypothetical protein [Gimesia chilikensis]QDU04052.1 hypothetical protein V6x_37770 [Gimesia chilikensis]